MPPNPAMQFFRGLTDVAAWWQRINSWLVADGLINLGFSTLRYVGNS